MPCQDKIQVCLQRYTQSPIDLPLEFSYLVHPPINEIPQPQRPSTHSTAALYIIYICIARTRSTTRQRHVTRAHEAFHLIATFRLQACLKRTRFALHASGALAVRVDALHHEHYEALCGHDANFHYTIQELDGKSWWWHFHWHVGDRAAHLGLSCWKCWQRRAPRSQLLPEGHGSGKTNKVRRRTFHSLLIETEERHKIHPSFLAVEKKAKQRTGTHGEGEQRGRGCSAKQVESPEACGGSQR